MRWPRRELATEVKLRRASASRLVEEFDSAIELANEVREIAVTEGNVELELKACLELGQAITRSEIGEAYWPLGETDADGADEAYSRALDLARETGSPGRGGSCFARARGLGIRKGSQGDHRHGRRRNFEIRDPRHWGRRSSKVPRSSRSKHSRSSRR